MRNKHCNESVVYLQVRNEFYADTQGALLVYDASDRGSFDALERWLEEMRAHVGNPRDMENVVFVVCANKVKINRSSKI